MTILQFPLSRVRANAAATVERMRHSDPAIADRESSRVRREVLSGRSAGGALVRRGLAMD